MNPMLAQMEESVKRNTEKLDELQRYDTVIKYVLISCVWLKGKKIEVESMSDSTGYWCNILFQGYNILVKCLSA